MAAIVDLGQIPVKPETRIRVLGLQIDDNLRWGPYVRKVAVKMEFQEKGLICLAASIWVAT